MGGNGSTGRKVSFGLDEEEKVTVIEGVKVTLYLTVTLSSYCKYTAINLELFYKTKANNC